MTIMGNLLLLASASLLTAAAHAADPAEFRAPRNEYGRPDLSGVWNFSSDVPMQRPKDAPDKLFQTREDIEKSKAAREKQFDQLVQQGVGFHNKFWLDYESVQLLDFKCVEFAEELLYGKYRKQPAPQSE